MTGALSIHFTAAVWRYESKGGWYFVSLPEDDSARIREMFRSQEQGWGRLNVEATFVRSAMLNVRGERDTIEMPDMRNELKPFKTERIREDRSGPLPRTSTDIPLTSHIQHRASHKTAIWFDTKRNTYLLPIRAEIRNDAGIEEGDEVDVTVRI
jgi:hypothetical protein